MAPELESEIDQLNAFLRSELGTVEIYNRCILELQPSNLRQDLKILKHSHLARIDKLSWWIAALGGVPENSSGMAPLARRRSATLSMLEAAEDSSRDAYVNAIGDVSVATRRFLENEIIPEQMRTHDWMSTIQAPY